MKITVEEFIELSDALAKAIDSVRTQKYVGMHKRMDDLKERLDAHCNPELPDTERVE